MMISFISQPLYLARLAIMPGGGMIPVQNHLLYQSGYRPQFLGKGILDLDTLYLLRQWRFSG